MIWSKRHHGGAAERSGGLQQAEALSVSPSNQNPASDPMRPNMEKLQGVNTSASLQSQLN